MQLAVEFCYAIRIAQKREDRLQAWQFGRAGSARFLEQRLEVAVLDPPAFRLFWRLGIEEQGGALQGVTKEVRLGSLVQFVG